MTDETLVDLIDGRLSADELARVHRHAAECDACHALLATVARGGLGVNAAPPPENEIRPEDATLSVIDPKGPPAARALTSRPQWTPPAEFDEFRLERMLGRGAMGVVYLANDTSLGRSVAVKFIASQQPDSLVRAHFEIEARAIARLQHPNVVTVHRVGTADEHPYIVSEYVVGRSLAELPLPLPWRRVLTLGLGLARGLAEAHRQGVLHRDLKPSNALVTEAGEVKLLDFGLAELFDTRGGARSSQSQVVAGTPLYMAPEVLLGEPATRQSDLYSLGLTLYELCTGKLPPRPFPQAVTSREHAGDSDRERKSLLAGLGPDIDPDFAALITRCLASEPTERFASADIFCEALERLEQFHATTPLAAGNPYRGLAPFEAEHRALFFGRDSDIRAVLERLRRQPLVLVAGDSGVGKSSLCRAGVLPRVTAGALDDGRNTTTVTLWPGRRPLMALAAALAPVLDRKEAEFVTALENTPAWLGQALRERFQGRRGLLLFVDQLEELITLSEPAQASRFAALLGELALPSAGVHVLLAVRGDFLTRVSALPGLGNEAERALFILRPMSPEGVREAIVGPARSRGVMFESDELIQTLVKSTAQGTGSLPLLQFALAELWERRNSAQGRITQAALDEMGGVAGALSRHADGVLARLSPTEQQAARRLLIQLVTAEDTRIERGEDELIDASNAAHQAALRALVEGRLLDARTAGGQARYEIAHDSLIQSWGTLRNWLDDDIGHRAVRQRVEAASTEWERLARAKEALWGQRQLDEARPLDSSTLGPREQAFLAASRRALRLQRWGRTLAVLLVMLALAAVYGGLRLQEYFQDARFVAAQIASAQKTLTEGRSLTEDARAYREKAVAMFDGHAPEGMSPASIDLREAAEQQWSEALRLRENADDAYARTGQFLEKALLRVSGQREARSLLTQVIYERMLLAENFYQRSTRDEQKRRLEEMIDTADDGAEWRTQLSASAELLLGTDPPGASVQIDRYVPDDRGVLHPQHARELGLTPITQELPEGSYLLHIKHRDRQPVDLPVLLTRGEREQVQFAFPPKAYPGYVYVPPGRFLLGSSEPEEVRRFMRSSPLHFSRIDKGYFIGRTEVTFGDWVTYLDTLPENAPERHLLDQPRLNVAGAVTLLHQAGVGWVFSLHRSRETVFTAEGEFLTYPDRNRNNKVEWRKLPLTGVSSEDLKNYFFWLSSKGFLPGARLCNELEWERAARGADGREYPHGDRLRPDDANIDATYGWQPQAFGPDEVGIHTATTSPFGLVDMVGNAYEMTRPATADLGRISLRGGAWYYDELAALVANRSAGDPILRDVTIGVRVCASFPPE